MVHRNKVRTPVRSVLWTTVWMVVGMVLTTGTAHADETHHDSHNAPRIALIQTGQIDDPLEDVLEHTLLLGDDYRWD